MILNHKNKEMVLKGYYRSQSATVLPRNQDSELANEKRGSTNIHAESFERLL